MQVLARDHAFAASISRFNTLIDYRALCRSPSRQFLRVRRSTLNGPKRTYRAVNVGRRPYTLESLVIPAELLFE
jgi:hypothetical protein